MSEPQPSQPVSSQVDGSLSGLLDNQSLCWRRGDRQPVEAYLARYPELRDRKEAILDLIYHEVLLRKRCGEAPRVEEYIGRFPEFGTELAVQFQVDAACSQGEPLPGMAALAEGAESFASVALASPGAVVPCEAIESLHELSAHAAKLSGRELGRFLMVDLQQRWQRGDHVKVESYVEAHPPLGADQEALIELISSEIALRQARQDRPSLVEYLSRFPQQEGELRRLLDQLVDSQPPDGTSGTPSPDHAPMATAAFAAGAGAAPADTDDPERTRSQAPEVRKTDRDRTGEKTPLPEVPGYELLSVLGRGGMGVVYKAVQTGLKRVVALKMILQRGAASPEQLERFRAEAEAVARLKHPNIVQIYEIGEHDGAPYFSLEFVSGGSLDRQLKGTPQPARQAAQLLETLARAIHAAHAQNIVHRDLKPANVLMEAQGLHPVGLGLPKLTDFGLAKQLDTEAGQTKSGDIVGTPSYMSPEQAFGKVSAIGPPTDIYALGAILYELITGRPPFKAETVMDTLAQVVSEEPVPPTRLQPKCPVDLETICLKCLHKEPRRRYATALDLAEDLRRFTAGEPIQARPTAMWERTWKWVKRHPTRTAVAASCFLVVVVLAGRHYVHLRAALAEAQEKQELATAVRGAAALVHKAEGAVNVKSWDLANDSLADARTLLTAARERFPADPEFAALQAQTERLQEQTEQHLTDQERYHALGAHRDDAAFYATGVSGLDVATNRDRIRGIVEQAFRMFALSVEGNGSLVLDSPYLTPEQRTEIIEGCYELLLDLAEAEADTATVQKPEERAAQAGKALAILDRAAKLGIGSAIYQQRRARYLALRNDPAGAAEERRQAAAAQRDRPFEHFLRGTDLYKEGKLGEAIDQFEKAIALQKNHFGAQYGVAVCYLKLRGAVRDLDRVYRALAVARLSNFIEQQPDRLWLFLLRGYAYSELQQFASAESDFAQVEKLLEKQPDATAQYGLLVNRGYMRIQQNNLSGAVADLTQAVRLKPREYPAYVNLAQAYDKQKLWREAIAQLDQAVALKPSQGLAGVYRTRARLRELQQDHDGALADLDRAVQNEPRGLTSPAVVEDLFEKGRILVEIKKHRAAVEALDALLLLQPDHAPAHRLRAEALLSQGRLQEAVQALTRYLDLEQEKRKAVAAAYQVRGKAQAQLGLFAPATEDYARALELEPHNAALYASRGWAFVVLEAPVLGLRDFDKVLELEPGNADALTGRGFCRARLGDHAQAVKDVEQAPSAPTGLDTRLLYNAARAYAQAVVAVARLEADGGASGATWKDLRQRYQKRAVGLVRDALDKLPAAQRSAFWQQTIQPDVAMNAIRRTVEFQQLHELYAKPRK